MENLPRRIALIYDSINKWGGAEEVLLSLHDIFPDAPLFTLVYDKKSAGWADVFSQIHTSFLQYFPMAKGNREYYPWLTPLAVESLDLTGFDAVISVTSADIKGIITPPGTFHFCYCLTPTRYLHSHHQEYLAHLGKLVRVISRPVFKYLRHWDLLAAKRPDTYVSISKTVKDRLQKYYHRDSLVVYPPVRVDSHPQSVLETGHLKNYYLYIGRLVFYKNPELIIRVFNRLNLPLVIIGTGKLDSKLKKIANHNIVFTGFVSDKEKNKYINNCTALVFFHEEDFGIVPVEVQAAGKPVIALNRGGASETVIHNHTGILVNDYSETALYDAILKFDNSKFDPKKIKLHAQKFSRSRFKEEFVKIFTTQWTKYKNTCLS